MRAPSAAPINEIVKFASTEDLAKLPVSSLSEEDFDELDQDLPTGAQPELRRKELIDMVIARSGVKRREARPAIETALAVLGEALSEGRELNLRPFGKLKVMRMRKSDNGLVLNTRVRQPGTDENSGHDPLAHAAE